LGRHIPSRTTRSRASPGSERCIVLLCCTARRHPLPPGSSGAPNECTHGRTPRHVRARRRRGSSKPFASVIFLLTTTSACELDPSARVAAERSPSEKLTTYSCAPHCILEQRCRVRAHLVGADRVCWSGAPRRLVARSAYQGAVPTRRDVEGCRTREKSVRRSVRRASSRSRPHHLGAQTRGLRARCSRRNQTTLSAGSAITRPSRTQASIRGWRTCAAPQLMGENGQRIVMIQRELRANQADEAALTWRD